MSVHRHEFVEGANPPYVTIELPIEVRDGNANGVFDDGDHILVWVQSWAERSRASWAQRAWGDGDGKCGRQLHLAVERQQRDLREQ